MQADLPILPTGPTLMVRKEPVPLPELKGSVIVRGLLASEVFAIMTIRQQAVRRMRDQAAPAEGEIPQAALELDYAGLVDYGKHVSHLLAVAVLGAGGMGFYTADEWEVFAQHYPDAYRRLQLVAERLSGMNAEVVAKNSPQSPSASSGSGSASDSPAALPSSAAA